MEEEGVAACLEKFSARAPYPLVDKAVAGVQTRYISRRPGGARLAWAGRLALHLQ